MRNLKKDTKVVIRYTGKNAGKEVCGTIRGVWNEGMRYDIELSTQPYGVQFGVPEMIVFPIDPDCPCWAETTEPECPQGFYWNGRQCLRETPYPTLGLAERLGL